jgi:hypothetical protein
VAKLAMNLVGMVGDILVFIVGMFKEIVVVDLRQLKIRDRIRHIRSESSQLIRELSVKDRQFGKQLRQLRLECKEIGHVFDGPCFGAKKCKYCGTWAPVESDYPSSF